MNAAISLRGEGSLLLRSPTASHKTVTPLLHRRLSTAAPVAGAKNLPFGRPHRADLGFAPIAAVGSTGGVALKDTSNNKVQTGAKKAPAITNCRVYSTEGTNNALEVVLSFVGDDGYEVGSPVDLSTFVAVPWKVKNEDGKDELLGVIHQGRPACGNAAPPSPVSLLLAVPKCLRHGSASGVAVAASTAVCLVVCQLAGQTHLCREHTMLGITDHTASRRACCRRVC
jgi:hypothetical protein